MFFRLPKVLHLTFIVCRALLREMGKYSDSSDWEDVVPIPQDDGGPNPLAAIAYTEEYSEAMSYLRAVMAEDEKSDRALRLTEDIIRMNPAHYTVWYIYKESQQTLSLTGKRQALQSGHAICLAERSSPRARMVGCDISHTHQELPDMVLLPHPHTVMGWS